MLGETPRISVASIVHQSYVGRKGFTTGIQVYSISLNQHTHTLVPYYYGTL